jgi:uncharacterized protein
MPKSVTLEQRHANIVRRILREHVPRKEVWAFGSRAGGSPKPHTDLDLVIVDPPLISESVFARLKLHFEESALPFRVDVSVLSALAVSLQLAIKQQHIAFVKPDEINTR